MNRISQLLPLTNIVIGLDASSKKRVFEQAGLLFENNQGIARVKVFETLVARWVPLTLLVNSLNRSLGQEDAYPFAPSPGALAKLRFVHDTIRQGLPPGGGEITGPG